MVTFRAEGRTTGETWWRQSRTGEKQGDVYVAEIGRVDPRLDRLLRKYVDKSGFENVGDWQTTIKNLHTGLPESGFLYLVVDTADKQAVVRRQTLSGGDTAFVLGAGESVEVKSDEPIAVTVEVFGDERA